MSPVRKDHAPWTNDVELADLRRLTEAIGLSAERAAAFLNQKYHKGRPVRSTGAVSMVRTKRGWRVAKVPRELKAVVGGEREQQVERVESESGIALKSVGSRIKTVAELLAYAKVDLTQYEVFRQTVKTWDTTLRTDGEATTVQNFAIHVEVKQKAGPSVLDAVESMIAGAFAPRKALATGKPVKATGNADLLQALVIADPHIAKHSWGRETGHGDYDIKIATTLLRQSCAELLEWGDREQVGKRAIWLLGDYFHYDTPNGQTTGGTALERDGRVEKMLEAGVAALVDIIEAAAARGHVDVVLVAGNHDALMTVALRHILTAHFRHDKRVTIDTRGTTRKYVTHGSNLIGLTHGDKAQKRLGELMAVEARAEWGRCPHREIHHGHKHSDAQVTTVGGVVIRQHPALCPPDGWHAVEGYVGAPRRMYSYAYDARSGLVGMRSTKNLS